VTLESTRLADSNIEVPMSRTIIPALVVLYTFAESRGFAQDVGPERSEPKFQTAELVGATAGSAAGFMVWWRTGGPFTSTGSSLGRLWLSTTVGTALGTWLSADPNHRPGLPELMIGSSFGLVCGAVLTMITASALDGSNSEAPGPALVLGFSFGQGAITALVGS